MGTSRLRRAFGAVLIGAALFATVASGEENTAKPADGGSEDGGSNSGGEHRTERSTGPESTRGSEDGGSNSGGEAQTFGVGEAVALGDWEVIVHGVTDPVPPGEFMTPSEGNRWVGVDVEVTNNSDGPETVSSILCFELQDAENKSYNMTIGADQAASPPDGEVDAGGSRRGTITYEVPAAATGLRLRFKCDLFSSGSAVINLGGAPAAPESTTTVAP